MARKEELDMNLRSEVSIKATLPEKDNIFVCRDCGRENVEEKAWTSINDHLIVDGKYYAYITDIDNPSSNYCYDCADECDVVSREDYLEENSRKCHSCNKPTINKYCENKDCEVYKRDEE